MYYIIGPPLALIGPLIMCLYSLGGKHKLHSLYCFFPWKTSLLYLFPIVFLLNLNSILRAPPTILSTVLFQYLCGFVLNFERACKHYRYFLGHLYGCPALFTTLTSFLPLFFELCTVAPVFFRNEAPACLYSVTST
jgi:hypothetical protein